MEYFETLPLEITSDILARLPTESVLECKLVCTAWRSLIRHPIFSKMHLQNLNHNDAGELSFIAWIYDIGSIEKFHYFEYNQNPESEPIQKIRKINFTPPITRSNFIGSCNGLVCLANPSVLICNPVTKEYIILPEIETDCEIQKKMHWTSGFGYVSSTNEYKVVGMQMLMNTYFVEVHIYTLGSGNGWKNLGEFGYEFGPYQLEEGIFANGALYWKSSFKDMILTFDLAKEKFCEHLSPPPLPPSRDNGDWWLSRICVLDGCLCFAVYLDAENCYDVWQLKKKNDNHDMKEQEKHLSLGWSKKFRVEESELLAVTKSGGVLSYIDKHLDFYDTKVSTSKRLVEFKENIHQVFTHKNTLVSLKELGEDDTKIMESAGIKETKSHDQAFN